MTKIIKYFLISFFSFFVLISMAQDVESGAVRVPACIDGNDTIPSILLQQVYVFPKLEFKSKKQERFFWMTVRDVKKTLPYAKLIASIISDVDSSLAKIDSEKEKKKFMEKKEEELVNTYKPILKKLTFSQGKMLIKLVDRECDQTSYALIKQFRGGFRAFFWQGFARMFGANLKSEYDAMTDDRDKIVERVIILVEAGQL